MDVRWIIKFMTKENPFVSRPLGKQAIVSNSIVSVYLGGGIFWSFVEELTAHSEDKQRQKDKSLVTLTMEII